MKMMKSEKLLTARYSYNFSAWFYQPMATMYSAGQIPASKACQIQYMQPGNKVLYAGVGPGEDSVLAAEHGVELTCVDLSQAMLKRAERKVSVSGMQGEFILGDIMQHDRKEYYDVICANYFLNVFSEPLMRKVLAHLVTLLKPGGKLFIADFSVPRGFILFRVMHIAYYRLANIFYWALSGNDLHPIYDYPDHLRENGIRHFDTRTFRLLRYGPAWFHCVMGEKPIT
jgi:ubiquinone/menaquinone biosynthesis C-methylase UbiE